MDSSHRVRSPDNAPWHKCGLIPAQLFEGQLSGMLESTCHMRRPVVKETIGVSTYPGCMLEDLHHHQLYTCD
eukprot:531940-Alexandrium_andersonii.AAC.1